MSSVDNRVVRMTFDNAQFEKKIKSTMEMLAQFEKSLKMDGATAGFNEISKAANKLDISAIGDKAADEADKVAQSASDASSSIEKIDDAAANTDFSAVSDAANDAAADVNRAAESTDFSPMSSGAQDAAIDINNAAASVDMSPVVQEANEAAESFNALEMVAAGVLFGIGQKILELAFGGLSQVGKKVKEYTLQPMIDGFKEYETQMGSIQTIMANTGMDFSADEDIATVNAALDELNTYADKTIYNFTEMTRNIGTFTAAGVDLETSKNAIQGIANLAALSGSNSQQASTAMYQLSQALSTGTLKLQDWNSVVNAGMGGEVFQNALKETARAHGVAVDEIIAANGSFRESLQEGWITSEILTETLNHMAISYDKVGDEAYNAALEEMTANGYTEEQAVEILRLAKVAEESATKVRTWSQLWDTVKESIGSQWSAIWRNFIGDFKQATDTFTFLSNTISDGVEAMFGGIINVTKIFSTNYEDESGNIINISKIFWGENLRVWNEKTQAWEEVISKKTGHFKRVKGAMDYLVEAFTKPLKAIGDAFNTVFGMDDATIFDNLYALVSAFKEFAKSLIISDDAATGIRQTFEGVFSVLDIGVHLVIDAIALIGRVIQGIRVVLDPVIDIVLTIFGQVGKIIMWFHDKILEVREAVVYALYRIGEAFGGTGELISGLFSSANFPEIIQNIGDALISLLEIVWDFVDIPAIIGEFGEYLGGFISTLIDGVAEIFGWNEAVDIANAIFRDTGEEVSVLDVWIGRLLQNPVIAFFKEIFDAIAGGISALTQTKEETEAVGEAGEKVAATWSPLGSVFAILTRAVEVAATVIRTLVVILSTVLSPILAVVLNVIKAIATIIGGILISGIFLLIDAFKAVSKFVEILMNTVGYDLINIFSRLAYTVGSLASAFGGFIGRMADFILSWEPLANVIALVKDFKDKVIDYILGIPDKIASAFGGVSDSVLGFSLDAEGFFAKMDEIINYFKNVTPDQFIADAKNFFKGIRDNIVNFAMDIPNKIKGVYDSLMNLNFEDIANNLVTGLENFKAKIAGDGAITNKGIFLISDILKFFGADKDTIHDVIETLYDHTLGPLSQFVSDISAIIQTARDNSSDIPSFIGNLLSGIGNYLLNGLTNIYNIVAGKIQEIFNYISNINPSDVAAFIEGLFIILYNVITNAFANIETILFNLISHFFGMGPASIIVGLLDSFILSPIKNIIWEVVNVLDWVRQNSTDWPSFIENLLIGVWTLIKLWGGRLVGFVLNGLKTIGLIFIGGIALIGKFIIDSIRAFISGEGTEEIRKSWETIGKTVNGAIRGFLDNISPKLREVYDKIINFFFGSEDEASKFSQIFGGIKDTIGNTIGNIVDTVTGFKDKVADAFDKLLTKASEIEGPIGDAFSFIKDKIDGLKEKFSGLEIPTSFSDFVTKLKDLFVGLKDAFKSFIFGSGEGDEQTNILERLKNLFGDKALDILAKIKNIPGAIADFLNGIIENISMETVQKVIDIVKLVLAAKLVDSLSELAKGTGKLTRAIARKINKEEQESIQDKLRSIAITFAIMAGVLWALYLIPDPVKAIVMLVLVAAIVVGMEAVSAALSKWSEGYKSGTELLNTALSIAAVAGGILLMLYAIEKLTQFDYKKNEKGLKALGAFLLLFVGVYAIFAAIGRFIGDGGKYAIQVAIGIGILAIALRLMLGPIETISEYWKKMDPNEIEKVGQGLFQIAGFIAVLAFALSLVPKKGAIGGAVAMVIMAASVSLIADALAKLAPVAMINPMGMFDIILGIGLLMGEFAAIAQVCKASELILASIAIVIFSAGITVMVDSLAKIAPLATLNPWGLIPIMAGIAVLIGEFAIISKVCKPAELMLAAVAIVIFSGAIYIISEALSKLAELPVPNLVAAGIAIGGIVLIFGILVGVLSKPAIAAGATVVLPLLALAFIALGAACLMIAKALQMTVQGIIGLAVASPILTMFVTTIASNALAFGVAAIALAAIGAAFLIFGPGAMLAGAGLMLLSAGIRDFLVLIAELPVLLTNASTSIQTLLGMFPNFIANLWTTITTWFNETLLPNIGGFFEGIFGKLGELKDKFMTWWNETGYPMISETASKFWDWVQTEGLPKLGEFVLGIFGKLGELKDKFFAWMESDGWPMLKEAGGKFWNWVQTDGLPKLGEFIGKVMGKLGELIGKVWNWIKTEGLPAAGRWVKDMVGKAKETFGPKIEEFIRDIPNKIATGLQGIWDNLVNKGRDIVNGIVEGMTSFDASKTIENAVTTVSSWIPSGIKKFFGINSPSKLMREEIGPYIPEGLAVGINKYASVAKIAATQMAEETMEGVRNGLDDTSYLSPTITPVIDINDFTKNMSLYNSMLSDSIFGGEANYNGYLSGEVAVSSQLASMIDDDMSRTDSLNRTMYDIQNTLQENTDKTEQLYSYTMTILDALNGNTSAIRDSVANGMNLYMDSGAMVGALAPEMDRALGRRAALAERGVY